jgi:integrase
MRFHTEDKIDRLLSRYIPPIRNLVECALNSGMRCEEIFGLKWNQIHNGFICLKKTKTRNPRQIPINDTLDERFKRIKSEQNPSKNVVGLNGKPAKGFNSDYVFSKNNTPYEYITNKFNAGTRRAGIEDFNFHDLRHTFAGQLLMKGRTLEGRPRAPGAQEHDHDVAVCSPIARS